MRYRGSYGGGSSEGTGEKTYKKSYGGSNNTYSSYNPDNTYNSDNSNNSNSGSGGYGYQRKKPTFGNNPTFGNAPTLDDPSPSRPYDEIDPGRLPSPRPPHKSIIERIMDALGSFSGGKNNSGGKRIIAIIIAIVLLIIGIVYLKTQTDFFEQTTSVLNAIVQKVMSIIIISVVLWFFVTAFGQRLTGGVRGVKLLAIIFFLVALCEFIPSLGSAVIVVVFCVIMFKVLTR